MQNSIQSEETSMSLTSEATEPMVPPMAKRLRPQTEQDLDQDQNQTLVHCPRCDSTRTKFCYYNNYSLSQPRYFCKSCRRYWTKGGTLRNIPVGGLARKSKKFSSISTINHHRRREEQPQQNPHYDKLAILADGIAISQNSIGLQLSYPESPAQFSLNPNFMLENLTIDFMDSGGGGGRDYEGGDHYPAMVTAGGYGSDMGNTHGLSPFGEMMSYYDDHYEKSMNGDDVKPKLCDLEWRDQMGCHSDLHGSGAGGNGSSGYLRGLGSSWAGLTNAYGSSSTNPLV